MASRSGASIAAILILCAAWMSAAPISSVQAAPLSLYDAWRMALNNDASFRAAMHEAAAGQEFDDIGRSTLLPQLQFTYSGGRNVSDITREQGLRSETTQERYRSHSAQLVLQQPVINLEYWARFRQGKERTEESEATFESRKQDLALRVSEAYIEVLLANDAIALAEAQKAALLEQRKVNEEYFKYGEGQRMDIAETEARYQIVAARELEARDRLTIAHKRLEGIIGRRIEAVPGLFVLSTDYLPSSPQPADREYWVNQALSSNWALRAMRHTVNVAQEEVAKARAGHVPRVDLVASYGSSKSETVNTLNTKYDTAYVGLRILVPIYAGGGVSAGVRQASAEYRKTSAQRDGLRISIIEEVRKQYDLTVSGIAKVQAYERAVQAADVLIQSTRKGMDAGMRVNLDLLNAQEERFQALRDLAQAKYETVSSRLRLFYVSGRLADPDVLEISRWFSGAGAEPVSPVHGAARKKK